MAQRKVTIADYGMCNLLNVARAFEHCGAAVVVTEDPVVAAAADRLVVPGVGAFRECMREVNERGFADAIRNYALSDRPMFGICVGMQMLFDTSEEFGEQAGLGVLAGCVKAVPSTTVTGEPQRVPHIGWNGLHPPETDRTWQKTLLQPFVGQRPAVYFVHSFAAQPLDKTDRLADCSYGGHRICAAIQRNNLMATQFHPERSGEVGLQMVKHFIEM